MRNTTLTGLMLSIVLLTGCNTQLISQQMVLSAAAVDVSTSPWQAQLEITLEEENEYITVEGSDFYELWKNAAHLYGSPVYLGALECVLLQGVSDGEELLLLLQGLQSNPQIGANTQIAFSEDATALFDGENMDGDAITALLTNRYTRSNDYSLKELTGLLLAEGRGGLIPWIAAEQDKAVIAGYTPTGSSDYTSRWEGNDLLYLVTGRTRSSHLSLPQGQGSAEIELTDPVIRWDGLKSGETPTIHLQVTATLLSVPPSQLHAPAAPLEAAIKQELFTRLEEIQMQVVEEGNTDLFGLGKRILLRNFGYFSNQKKDAVEYRVTLRLRDPKGLLAQG